MISGLSSGSCLILWRVFMASWLVASHVIP